MFRQEARILVIDDMVSIRDLVRSQLRAMNYLNVFEAENGEEAYSFLLAQAAAGAPIELVISDWNMPQMTGLDLLRRVRGNDQFVDLPFILLTSESERDQVTEAVLSGVSQYIVKPFSGKIFEDKLRATWQKHRK